MRIPAPRTPTADRSSGPSPSGEILDRLRRSGTGASSYSCRTIAEGSLINLVLLGPPGVGKGTQAQRLASILKAPHISSGELLRAYAREDTPLASAIREAIDLGAYVPDDVIVDLILVRLRQPDAQAGFILDGFPRTLFQAEALDRALATEGRKVDFALSLTASVTILLRRLAGRRGIEARTDDVPDVIRTRLRISLNTIQPLITYYGRQGKLVTIDAAGPVDEVNREVDSALGLPV